MLYSTIPAKFTVPWGNGAGSSYIRQIPTASQIGTTPGAASLVDGFPPLAFTPVQSGGVPPFGQDMNGILNQVTAWLRWNAAGGPIYFDASFCSAIGGYPQGALVASTTLGRYWISTVDNNLTNPDAPGAANWLSPFSGFITQGIPQHAPIIFAAPGPYSWTVPAGIYFVAISDTCGGGGGGGGCNGTQAGGGGGGGGQTKVWMQVTPGGVFSGVVGSAGTGGGAGGNGTAGGTTSIYYNGAIVAICNGGGGGGFSPTGAGGPGGTASGGNSNWTGGYGSDGAGVAPWAWGGNGAPGLNGAAGGRGGAGAGMAAAAGPGAGGGGAYGTSGPGGNGSPGQVRFDY